MTRDEWINEVFSVIFAAHNAEKNGMECATEIVNRVILPALPVWRTIETAPKDGSWFLGYQATPGDFEKRVDICHWQSWRRNDGATGGLFMAPGGLIPTHWMPLSPPPEGE